MEENDIHKSGMSKHTTKIPLPLNIKEKEQQRFLPFCEYETEQFSIIKLKNVCITRSGIVTKNLKLVTQSVYAYADRHSKYWKSAMFNLLFRKWTFLPRNNSYTIAQNYYCPGYFHWITEALPRLIALEDKCKDLVLLLPEYDNTTIKSTLEIFQFKEIKTIKSRTTLLVEKLVMASNPKYGNTFSPSLLHKLRERYTELAKNKATLPSEFGSKIYVSRKMARARKVVNENEVVALLEKNGFKEVCFESFSFFEQVLISSQATQMVGIHGAGLTNMVFMPKGSHILELHRDFISDDEYHSITYWRLAGVMQLHYSYQLCAPDGMPNSFDTDDLIVDLAELEQNLRIMASDHFA